jgi:hypothetical protein
LTTGPAEILKSQAIFHSYRVRMVVSGERLDNASRLAGVPDVEIFTEIGRRNWLFFTFYFWRELIYKKTVLLFLASDNAFRWTEGVASIDLRSRTLGLVVLIIFFNIGLLCLLLFALRFIIRLCAELTELLRLGLCLWRLAALWDLSELAGRALLLQSDNPERANAPRRVHDHGHRFARRCLRADQERGIDKPDVAKPSLLERLPQMLDRHQPPAVLRGKTLLPPAALLPELRRLLLAPARLSELLGLLLAVCAGLAKLMGLAILWLTELLLRLHHLAHIP